MADIGTTFTVEMPVEDWIELPGHPRQRKTERQANADHWTLAKRASGPVRAHLHEVKAAEMGGKICKVDGHTRAYLWEKDRLPWPEKVFATIYRCDTVKQLNDLYSAIDNSSAAEKEFDKIYGAFRELKFEPQSTRLQHTHLSTAIHLAMRGKTKAEQKRLHMEPLDLYKAVAALLPEFKLLDSVDPQPNVFVSGVVAGALIGLSLYPQEIEFFQRLAREEGNKQAGKMDPVESVLKLIDESRTSKRLYYQEQHLNLCGRTLRAFLAWVNRDEEGNQFWFTNRLHAVDLNAYITEMKTKKGILEDPDL